MKGRHTIWAFLIYTIWGYYSYRHYYYAELHTSADCYMCPVTILFVIITCGILIYLYIKKYSKSKSKILDLLDNYFTI